MKVINLIGRQFGKLTVIMRASSNRSGQATWLCNCDCGNEKVYSSDHLTRKTNPVKSCGCLLKGRKGKEHPSWSGIGDMSGNWWYNHVERERKQGIRNKVPVTITKEYAWELFLKQNKQCALSGLPLVISGNSSTNTASIDRIDSSRGYEEGNIQWVHKHVNFMKRTYTQDYFIFICSLIAKKAAGNTCEVH